MDELKAAYADFISRQPGFIGAGLHVNDAQTRIANYSQWQRREDFLAMLRSVENARAQPPLLGAVPLASSLCSTTSRRPMARDRSIPPRPEDSAPDTLEAEVRALHQELKFLREHKMFALYQSVPRVLLFRLAAGMAAGLGTVVGATFALVGDRLGAQPDRIRPDHRRVGGRDRRRYARGKRR